MFLSQVESSGGFFSLAPLVVVFPIIGLLINLIFGKRLGEKAVGAIASTASGLAFVVAILQMVSLLSHPEGAVIHILDWIKVGELTVPWAFQVDTLSVTMMLVVSGVGTLIHIYAIGYMHEDVRHHNHPERFARFFVYLNLFIALMMVLVTANNYIMMFVGWEGVGLCSYLLIGFWYEKGKDGIGNAVAAKKAMVVNRIGDFGFLIAAFLMFHTFRTLIFNDVFAMAPAVAVVDPKMLLAITLFLLLGVTGKSAQIPLFVWLPDAMAGPTPVSALIHAATMVTAGVYLVARSHVLYTLAPQAQNIVALVGGLTAVLAATIAVGQFDIKKVLAYSTISQLGFMVAAVGMGAFVAGMFHLVMHAFFKALLFLSAGSVIQGMEKGEHAMEHNPKLKKTAKGHEHEFDPQDMRNMGGLRSRMKTTYWVYLIGALALAGIPPLAGFWSKDEILAQSSHLNVPVYILLTIAAFFTAFYMGRQVLLVFFGAPRTEEAAHAQENPPVMLIPLTILAVLSFFGGLINFPGIDSFGTWLEHTLQVFKTVEKVVGANAAAEAAGFNLLVSIIATGLAVIAIAVAWYIYRMLYPQQQNLPPAKRADDPLRKILGPVFVAMEHRWWIDELYQKVVVNTYVWFSRVLTTGEKEAADTQIVRDFVHDEVLAGGYRLMSDFLALTFDLGFVDALVNIFGNLFLATSRRVRRLQSGYVSNYALGVFLGVVIIVSYLIWRVTLY